MSAYIVDGLQSQRVKPILDAAIARFRMFQRMRTELAETKKALEERKVIDRAKGMLMRAKGIGEDEAYALLRKAAMDQGKTRRRCGAGSGDRSGAIVMKAVTVSVGFIPLVDAAPLIVAQEMGFAAEEGIALALRRAPSWASLRDMLSFGQVEAAHMLSPIPVATALGLGRAGAKTVRCFCVVGQWQCGRRIQCLGCAFARLRP